MTIEVEFSGISDPGLVRPNNEDAWGKLENFPLFVLADGMGGHQAGEVASKEAVTALLRVMRDFFQEKTLGELSPEEIREQLFQSIELVNTIVYSIGRSDEHLSGMGTTLITLYIHQNGAVIGHVGDSRIYRLRLGNLAQLTRDNTLASQLIEQGYLEQGDAAYYSYKNIITKAIGNGTELFPATQVLDVENEDLFLLCSDGLTDMLNDEQIKAAMEEDGTLDQIAERLVVKANEAGGYDNITAVLVKIHDKDLSR